MSVCDQLLENLSIIKERTHALPFPRRSPRSEVIILTSSSKEFSLSSSSQLLTTIWTSWSMCSMFSRLASICSALSTRVSISLFKFSMSVSSLSGWFSLFKILMEAASQLLQRCYFTMQPTRRCLRGSPWRWQGQCPPWWGQRSLPCTWTCTLGSNATNVKILAIWSCTWGELLRTMDCTLDEQQRSPSW